MAAMDIELRAQKSYERMMQSFSAVRKSYYSQKFVETLSYTSNRTSIVLESLGAIKSAPGIRYVLMHGNQLSASCRAGIFDTKANTWVLRLDNAHKGFKFPHVNINYKLTGVPDPHIKVPGVVVTSGEMITKSAQIIATVAYVAAVCNDSYRFFKSWYDDYNESQSLVPGKNVIKTGTSIVATWTGGKVGVMVGSSSFAFVGSIIGSPFGPAGALVGGSVLSVFGSVIGGFYGAYGGYNFAKSIDNMSDETPTKKE